MTNKVNKFLARWIPIGTVPFPELTFTQNAHPIHVLIPLFFAHGPQATEPLQISPPRRGFSNEPPGVACTAIQHDRDCSISNSRDGVALTGRLLINGRFGWLVCLCERRPHTNPDSYHQRSDQRRIHNDTYSGHFTPLFSHAPQTKQGRGVTVSQRRIKSFSPGHSIRDYSVINRSLSSRNTEAHWPIWPESIKPDKGTYRSLKTGCLLLVPWVSSPGLFLVDLSTVVVAPTTCSLTICLTTCKGVPKARRIAGGGGPESAKNCRGGGSRKRVENSLESWFPVDNSCGGNYLGRRETPQERLSAGRGPSGLPRLRGAVRGKPYGGKGEPSLLVGLD